MFHIIKLTEESGVTGPKLTVGHRGTFMISKVIVDRYPGCGYVTFVGDGNNYYMCFGTKATSYSLKLKVGSRWASFRHSGLMMDLVKLYDMPLGANRKKSVKLDIEVEAIEHNGMKLHKIY